MHCAPQCALSTSLCTQHPGVHENIFCRYNKKSRNSQDLIKVGGTSRPCYIALCSVQHSVHCAPQCTPQCALSTSLKPQHPVCMRTFVAGTIERAQQPRPDQSWRIKMMPHHFLFHQMSLTTSATTLVNKPQLRLCGAPPRRLSASKLTSSVKLSSKVRLRYLGT